MVPPWRAPAGLNVAFGLNRFDKGANPIKVQGTGVRRESSHPRSSYRNTALGPSRGKRLYRMTDLGTKPIFMYQRDQREDVVRIPPERLGEDIDAVARELTRTTLEGKIGADKTLTLIASNIERVGEGRIVHGDGAVYQRVRYDALVFAPTLQEIVEGTLVEILQFAAIVRVRPLDGLRRFPLPVHAPLDPGAAAQRL